MFFGRCRLAIYIGSKLLSLGSLLALISLRRDASRAFATPPPTFLDCDASLLRHRPSRLISYGHLLSLSFSPPFRKPPDARSIEFHFPHFHPVSRSPSFHFGINIFSRLLCPLFEPGFEPLFVGSRPSLLSFSLYDVILTSSPSLGSFYSG